MFQYPEGLSAIVNTLLDNKNNNKKELDGKY
jgi:hypothetical protein